MPPISPLPKFNESLESGSRAVTRPVIVPDEDLFARFRVSETPRITIEEDFGGLDTRYLQPLLYFLARTHHAQTIVEIGAGRGGSFLPLLKAASEMGGCVYSVDSAPGALYFEQDIVARYGLWDSWKAYLMSSDKFFATVAPQQIDFAFVDGDHTCAAVARDASNILDRLVPGGIVIFHEYDVPNIPPYELLQHLRRESGPGEFDTTIAGHCGTPRALREVLSSYDVDVLPLDFGACGHDRVEEWTEAGAILIRKRQPAEFRVR